MSERLSEIRDQINEIDSELVELLNRRLRLALNASSAKLIEGTPVLDAHREDEVIAHVCELNEGPMTDDQLIALYLELMRQSRQLQEVVRSNPSAEIGKTPPAIEWYIPSIDVSTPRVD